MHFTLLSFHVLVFAFSFYFYIMQMLMLMFIELRTAVAVHYKDYRSILYSLVFVMKCLIIMFNKNNSKSQRISIVSLFESYYSLR